MILVSSYKIYIWWDSLLRNYSSPFTWSSICKSVSNYAAFYLGGIWGPKLPTHLLWKGPIKLSNSLTHWILLKTSVYSFINKYIYINNFGINTFARTTTGGTQGLNFAVSIIDILQQLNVERPDLSGIKDSSLNECGNITVY